MSYQEPPEEPEADMPYICPYCELDCTVDKYGNVNCIDCGEFRLKDYDNWDEDL
jgi:hypothetical protein